MSIPTLVVKYESDLQDENTGQVCCARYGPISLEITRGDETMSLANAGMNVEVFDGEPIAGFQWVDNLVPWSDTVFGAEVDDWHWHISSGRDNDGSFTTALPLTVNLDDWDVKRGCFDLIDVENEICIEIQVFLPTHLVGELVATVISLNLQSGISNALDSKLDTALRVLEDTNHNNNGAAFNSLYAFCSSVEAQRGKKLPTEDADTLIAAVNEIIGSLDEFAMLCQ